MDSTILIGMAAWVIIGVIVEKILEATGRTNEAKIANFTVLCGVAVPALMTFSKLVQELYKLAK